MSSFNKRSNRSDARYASKGYRGDLAFHLFLCYFAPRFQWSDYMIQHVALNHVLIKCPQNIFFHYISESTSTKHYST